MEVEKYLKPSSPRRQRRLQPQLHSHFGGAPHLGVAPNVEILFAFFMKDLKKCQQKKTVNDTLL